MSLIRDLDREMTIRKKAGKSLHRLPELKSTLIYKSKLIQQHTETIDLLRKKQSNHDALYKFKDKVERIIQADNSNMLTKINIRKCLEDFYGEVNGTCNTGHTGAN